MKRFVLLIILCGCLTPLFSQEKWYKLTKNDAVILSLQTVSGVADGFNQAIVHHKFGQGNQFWDNKVSWTNKYKWPSKDPKFFGSTTFLVWTTDGFHLTRMIDRSSTLISVGLAAGELRQYKKKDIPKVILKKIILSYLVNRASFYVTFNSL